MPKIFSIDVQLLPHPVLVVLNIFLFDFAVLTFLQRLQHPIKLMLGIIWDTLLEIVPVDVSEESMLLYVLDAGSEIWIAYQDRLEQVFALICYVLGPVDVAA